MQWVPPRNEDDLVGSYAAAVSLERQGNVEEAATAFVWLWEHGESVSEADVAVGVDALTRFVELVAERLSKGTVTS